LTISFIKKHSNNQAFYAKLHYQINDFRGNFMGNKIGLIGLLLGIVAIGVAFYKYSQTPPSSSASSKNTTKTESGKKDAKPVPKPAN